MLYAEDYIRKWDMDAKRTKEALIIRRKITNLFNRKTLEKLSGMPSPWLADTATLKQAVMTRWPVEMINREIALIMDKA